MKRVISSLLVMVLCLSGLTVSAALPFFQGEVQNVAFSATIDEGTPSPIAANPSLNTSALPQLTQLLTTAAPVAAPKAPTASGTLQVTTVNKTYEYPLYYTDNSMDIYLTHPQQGQHTFYKIDGEQWNTFTTALSQGLYTYSPLPMVSAGTGDNAIALGIVESSYRYQKLNGTFYRILPSETMKAVPTISLEQLASVALPTQTTPKNVEAVVLKDGKEIWKDTTLAALSQFSPSASGEYIIQITAEYDQPYYKGTVVSQGKIIHKQSTKPSFSIVGSDTSPGELLVLRAHNIPKEQKIIIKSNVDFTPTFFDDGAGGQTAFLPVSYRHNAGQYTITLSAGEISSTFKVSVKDKIFQIQHLSASQETTNQTLLNQKANDEFEKHIGPIRYTMEPTPYWQQADFIWPVGKARITTQFGMKRYVNGAPTSYRHGAIDFAVPLGTPVKATGNGKILYAGFLQLTGNTVVIEHGYGLKSWYYHMNSLDVNTGDIVTAGQLIGAVGSTGFSTGPHLHFGFSINNVFINPDTIIEEKLLTLDE